LDLNLKGARALVTGASQGIGLACATVLAAEGVNLLIAARRGPELESVAEDLLTRYGVDVQWKAIDLSASGSAEALAQWAADGVDILVNNAGAIPTGELLELDEETWRRAWDLKVFGYINLTRAIYREMKRRKKGVVVNIIGSAAEQPSAGYIAGASANASLAAFTRGLASAAPWDGVRVVGIHPGPTQTERYIGILQAQAQERFGDASRYEELMSELPFARACKPEEIANAVAFFASDRSAYTNGSILMIDGGFSLSRGR